MSAELGFFNSEAIFPTIKPEEENIKSLGFKETVRSIKKDTPFVTDLKPLNVQEVSWNSEYARLNALSTEHVTGIAWEGFDIPTLKQAETRPMWEFETMSTEFPKYLSIERRYLREIIPNKYKGHIPECATKGDKSKVFDILDAVAKTEDVTEHLGKNIDIRNLTPYEATYIIGQMLHQYMNYDYLVTRDIGMIDNAINRQRKVTGKGHLLGLKDLYPEVFKEEMEKYMNEVDKMGADEILDGKWGVCRHFAAVASFAFETLKEKQESNALNGTYLLYYSTTSPLYKETSGIERHAFNILVSTSPETDTTKAHTTITCVDPTEAVSNGINEFDVIAEATFAIPTFVKQFGEEFGIENNLKEAMDLADAALKRIEELGREVNILDVETERFLANCMALYKLSSIGNNPNKIILKLAEIAKHFYGKNFPLIALKFLEMPVITVNNWAETRAVNEEYVRPIYEGLEHFDFSQEKDNPWMKHLLENMGNNLIAVTQNRDLKKQTKVLKSDDYPIEVILKNVIRAYNMTETAVPSELAVVVETNYEVLKSLGRPVSSKEDYDKFLALAPKREMKADDNEFFLV